MLKAGGTKYLSPSKNLLLRPGREISNSHNTHDSSSLTDCASEIDNNFTHGTMGSTEHRRNSNFPLARAARGIEEVTVMVRSNCKLSTLQIPPFNDVNDLRT